MSVSKFLIYELTVSIFCFFLSHLRQDSPENIRGQENGMIPVCKGLNVFVMSFKRQNDVTPSTTINDVTFDLFSVTIDVKAAHTF